jgi:hypothetical protein
MNAQKHGLYGENTKQLRRLLREHDEVLEHLVSLEKAE